LNKSGNTISLENEAWERKPREKKLDKEPGKLTRKGNLKKET
jgi:hypothetical protein